MIELYSVDPMTCVKIFSNSFINKKEFPEKCNDLLLTIKMLFM